MNANSNPGGTRPLAALGRMFLPMLVFSTSTSADALPPGLEFGQSYDQSLTVMQTRCSSTRRVDVEPPSFPVAVAQEVHLVCTDYRNGSMRIERVALTFADDRLAMFFADGNTLHLKELSDKPLKRYLHFDASFEDLLVLDPQAGRAWILSEDAAHPNLFMWANPYVEKDAVTRYAASAAVPGVLRFGATLEDLEPAYQAQCAFMELAQYPVWLLSQPEVQQQLDCFGFEFAGFPRKIEAVFGDGILQQAWILTGKGEEDRVREALVAEFGDPIHVDAKWEIFGDGGVMLRKDKPEVLMLSDTLAPLYRAEYID